MRLEVRQTGRWDCVKVLDHLAGLSSLSRREFLTVVFGAVVVACRPALTHVVLVAWPSAVFVVVAVLLMFSTCGSWTLLFFSFASSQGGARVHPGPLLVQADPGHGGGDEATVPRPAPRHRVHRRCGPRRVRSLRFTHSKHSVAEQR